MVSYLVNHRHPDKQLTNWPFHAEACPTEAAQGSSETNPVWGRLAELVQSSLPKSIISIKSGEQTVFKGCCPSPLAFPDPPNGCKLNPLLLGAAAVGTDPVQLAAELRSLRLAGSTAN